MSARLAAARPAQRFQAVTLVVADDSLSMLRTVGDLLRSEGDLAVLARCRRGHETLHAVRTHHPDVLVLSGRFARADGLSVIRRIRAEELGTSMVVLAASLEDEQILEATRLGVRGVVLTEMAHRRLATCIRRVHATAPRIERTPAARALENLLRREAGVREITKILTPRDLEIVRMVAAGRRSRADKERAPINDGAMKAHLRHIYRKLGVRNRGELLLYCKDKGVA
jgi:two-component system, NarL family, nitrate/nitrite response regulator NarL